jgi:hypothetical protein
MLTQRQHHDVVQAEELLVSAITRKKKRLRRAFLLARIILVAIVVTTALLVPEYLDDKRQQRRRKQQQQESQQSQHQPNFTADVTISPLSNGNALPPPTASPSVTVEDDVLRILLHQNISSMQNLTRAMALLHIKHTIGFLPIITTKTLPRMRRWKLLLIDRCWLSFTTPITACTGKMPIRATFYQTATFASGKMALESMMALEFFCNKETNVLQGNVSFILYSCDESYMLAID